ncbi:LysM peptidoglycan-binding domain-containing protein [Aquirufa regiilacus]|uniref:LysM peptidoglycan-binding domain-containing protein n=1 Tax=Aquirufa regiilacus TaxID=3024868 RepID=A0ABU3TUS3_9BACT|nr:MULTISPECIES: LysM peptidoglycan-binding domain-containing protein [unclassified Aquirufa]MDT8887606.1 LysM peptidoglycan-binding domain-containing protein [Aquirufa sp. LEPPI-3A]MDU0809382.1 LysM peptidoglycan-binding domain-containing protein [Aquirufa sp. LEOWEIH-7C]
MKNPFSFMKESESSNLPLVTLFVLIGTVVALLFVGYEHFLGPETSSLAKAEKVQVDEDELPMEDIVSSTVIRDTTSTDTTSVDQDAVDLDQQKKEAEAEKVPEVAVEEPSGKSFTYQADPGESAETIAKHFGLTVDQLKAMNPAGVKGGSRVKVKVQAIHIVGKGDVLRVVAEKYHISKKALMDANHKKEDVTMRGEELVIPLQ